MGRTSDVTALVRRGAHARPVLSCLPGSSLLGRRRLILGGGPSALARLQRIDPGCGWDKGRGSSVELPPGNASDVTSDVACGLACGVVSGVVSGVASDVVSDVTSSVVSDVAPGVASGIAPGIVSRVVSGDASGVAADVASGVAPGLLSGVAPRELRASTVHLCCGGKGRGAGVEPRLSRRTALLGVGRARPRGGGRLRVLSSWGLLLVRGLG